MNSNIERCQIFTSPTVVSKLLDVVGYSDDILDKKIIENSCGDGSILLEVVRRYIVNGLKNKLNIDEIKLGLETNIFGYEIEQAKIDKCHENLISVASTFGIENVQWQLFCCDYLKVKHINQFDFVVGNPPYISYRNLNLEEREYIRENYETCSHGKFDIYYAFLEAGIKSMNNNGKMVYLVPSNMFKCTFGKQIRELVKLNLTDIYDYKTEKIFKKLTNSVILRLNKGKALKHINYHDLLEKTNFKISIEKLDNKWIFVDSNFIKDLSSEKKHLRFGDHFNAQITIATLLNKAFILNNFEDVEDDFVIEKNSSMKIEKTIVKKSVSLRSITLGKEERIIFPYYYANGELTRYSEKEFSDNFPLCKQYLSLFRDKLNKRNSHDNVKWFEYGRSQALKKLNEPKLLVSILITKEVNTHILDKDTIPTSGILITALSNYSLEIAQKILHSDEFMNYVKNIGIICNGRSYKITPNDINEFLFDSNFLEDDING